MPALRAGGAAALLPGRLRLLEVRLEQLHERVVDPTSDPAPELGGPAMDARRRRQTLQGAFSAVSKDSKPNFGSKSSCESSRRDPHNTLLCTVLVGSAWVKKYAKINIEKITVLVGSKLNVLFQNR